MTSRKSVERATLFRAYQTPLSALRVERAIPNALMTAGFFQGISYIQKWADEKDINIDDFIQKALLLSTDRLCTHGDDWGVFDQAEPMEIVPSDMRTLFYDYCSGIFEAAGNFKSWTGKNGIDGSPIIHALYDFHRRETDSFETLNRVGSGQLRVVQSKRD